MRPTDNIHSLIRKLHLKAGAELDQRLRAEIRSALDEQRHTKPAATRPKTWRIIMKSRITKLAAAAVIIIAVLVTANHFDLLIDGTIPAYGITDVPRLLAEAETLHTQATLWLYTDDESQEEFTKVVAIPLETWLDIANMRERFISYESFSGSSGEKRRCRIEGFRDREYAMDIRHGIRTVRYNKVSLIKRQLELSRLLYPKTLSKIAADISAEHDSYVKVGQESVDGTMYDIWQQEDQAGSGQRRPKKVKCWLSPTTGEIGRLRTWTKAKSGDDSWRPSKFIEKIERNIEIHDSVFEFVAPEDYKYANTKETAFTAEGLGAGWSTMGRARVSVAINFTLDDGSVIVAWHSDDLEEHYLQEQEHLFKYLEIGGELPKLPMIIHGLKRVYIGSDASPEVSYTGRHLAFTKQAGWYYEWALYVPTSQPPQIVDQNFFYRLLCRFNLPIEQAPEVGNPIPQNRIEPDEFNTFVRGAMAELSDDGIAPEHVTYNKVLRIAENMRTALE